MLVGRPYLYGLAPGGQAGVEHVLRCLLAGSTSRSTTRATATATSFSPASLVPA